MDKHSKYIELVKEVNNCAQCDNITAKSRDKSKQIVLEHAKTKHVNLWSYWQGNLSPEILVIGQDWGQLPNKELMAIYTNSDVYRSHIINGKSKTDKDLVKLFQEVFMLNILEEKKLFFTNSVFCYKRGKSSENLCKLWFKNCNSQFMGRLIAILEPRCIVTLGEKALCGLAKCGSIQYSDNRPVKINDTLATIVQESNHLWWNAPDGQIRIILFPVFLPCSNSNRNRPFLDQVKDWERIKPFVNF